MCEDNPNACGPGTICQKGQCVPTAQAKDLPVTEERLNALPWVLDPSLTEENGKLFIYYTAIGGPPGSVGPLPDALSVQTKGRVLQTIPFAGVKWEINPDTLEFVGDPTELQEFGAPVIGPELSGDGLWMIFACYGDAFGGPATGNEDLCIARRDAQGDEWSNFRWLEEISGAATVDTDGSFRPDDTGNPVQVFWTATGTGQLGSASNDLCVADFDSEAPATCVQGACRGVIKNDPGNCTRFQPSEPLVISDPYAAETCPTWTPDGRFFLWARSGLGTRQFDVLVGESTNVDGVVDTFHGGVSSNTESNEIGVAIRPLKNFAVFGWVTVPDFVFLSEGSNLNLGKLALPK
jgi:hypothetical protein